MKKDDYEQMKKDVLDEIMVLATGKQDADPVEIGDMIREKLLPLADFEQQ
jgi:DNA-binding protein